MRLFLLVFVLVVSLLWLLVPQVVYVLVWVIGRLCRLHVAWRPFACCSVVLLAVWWVVYAYGHWVGRFHWEVKSWTYADNRVPQGFRGYRIVHISDFHIGGWQGQESRLRRLVGEINALNPDLICFTGDLVSMDYRELEPLVSVLRTLHARDGVVSIMGNHDYDPYDRGISVRQRADNVQRLMDMERNDLGWILLTNQHVILHRGADSMAVIGVENHSCGAHRVIRRGRLRDAVQGTEGLFRILLSHDTSHWRAEVVEHTDIPLTLSGHTHAMQMRILGFTPSRWIYPECDGRYDAGHQTLYVNIGLGGTLPMRIGARPEVTLLTLAGE
ncbi:MAG: metallophosphoesterase [Bacteroidaceae bacterium]